MARVVLGSARPPRTPQAAVEMKRGSNLGLGCVSIRVKCKKDKLYDHGQSEYQQDVLLGELVTDLFSYYSNKSLC